MEETVKVTIPVITRYNGPDVNGRVYSAEVLEKAFNEAIKERGFIPICYSVSDCPTKSYFSESIDLSTVIGQVTGKDKDGNVIGEFNSNKETLIKLMKACGFKAGMRSIGKIHKDPDNPGIEIVDEMHIISYEMDIDYKGLAEDLNKEEEDGTK